MVMGRRIVQTRDFERDVERLISSKKLLRDDFEDLKKSLIENPDQGDLLQGTGGIRKTRLKSASKGKSGGFRVCYLDLKDRLILFLLFIYQKNEMENLSSADKNELKELVKEIKKEKI